MIDVRRVGIQFRGAPVALMSEGVAALFSRCGGLDSILRTATDVEPSGCLLQSSAVTGTMPSWVLDALDDNTRRKLILSWRRVPERGIVVIAADMEEVELGTEHDAKLFLAGISSAMTAYHDGKAAP